MISCTLLGCLDHYTTSVDSMDCFYRVFVYFFTFRLVSYVWGRSCRSPPASNHDDVAGQDIDMDLAEAQVRCTTRFRFL